jgi:hypothetical protein
VEAEIKRLAGQICTDCWSEGEAAQWEELAGLAGKTLPRMKGTKKQVRWARAIRGKQMFRFRSELIGLDRERVRLGLEAKALSVGEAVLARVLSIPKAKWWIDTREDSALIRRLMDDVEAVGLKDAEREAEEARERGKCGPDCPF